MFINGTLLFYHGEPPVLVFMVINHECIIILNLCPLKEKLGIQGSVKVTNPIQSTHCPTVGGQWADSRLTVARRVG